MACAPITTDQLREHITESAAAWLEAEPIGRCWIWPAIGSPTLGRRRNIRVDRVRGGFRVYYGTLAELRKADPEHPVENWDLRRLLRPATVPLRNPAGRPEV